MMTHGQNSNGITDNSKQKMIREALKVHAPEIALSNRKRFGVRCRVRHEMPQL
jgi:hypothetical protein